MDASGTKSSRVEAYVEAIRQQWRDWLREEEEEEEEEFLWQGRGKYLKLGGHDTSRALFPQEKGAFLKIKGHFSVYSKTLGARAPSSWVYGLCLLISSTFNVLLRHEKHSEFRELSHYHKFGSVIGHRDKS